MGVLVVHPRDPAAPTLGGIQTFLGDFIKYAPPDFDISFVGLSRDTSARPVGRWLNLDVHGRRIRFLAVGSSRGPALWPRSVWRTVTGLARMWRALAEPGRILQVHRPYRPFLLRRHHGPAVQFIHLDLRDWPGPSGWPKLTNLYRDFSDATLERMDRVFIVNEAGAELLRDEHPRIAQSIDFLPVWYDDALFRAVDTETRAALRADLRHRLGLDRRAAALAHADDRFVLMAVRLTDIKKPLLAIEAMAALTSQAGPVHLIVAGTGELEADARALAQRLGVAERVHFLGDRPRDEIARLMQASDALLLTARSEGGGPRVVLEALACGLPVVSTRVVEVGRTVTSRSNGWLVDEATPRALAEGLEWILAQPHESFRDAATSAAAPFTARNVLASLYDAYRELARAHMVRRETG